MNKNSFGLRSASAAAIIGLTLTLGAPVAMAQTETSSPVITKDTGTLTIHKQGNLDSDGKPINEFNPLDPTGEPQNAPGTPLNGATFSVYEIFKVEGGAQNKVDLKTNQSIAEAAGIAKSGWVKDSNKDQYTLTNNGIDYVAKPYKSGTTGGSGESKGQVAFSDVPTGAYFVVETKAPEGYAPSAPFVAFVPMTSGNKVGGNGGTSWNYDVHAYPKNYNSTAVKEVVDTNQQVGQDVVFKITGDVPANLDPTNGLTKFDFQDDLDETKVAYKPQSVKLDAANREDKPAYIEVLNAAGEVVGTLSAGTDFNISVSDAAKQDLTATLTPAGLAKFNSQWKEAGKKMRLVFAAKVNASGDLTNKAVVVTNNGTGGGETTTTTNPTDSYWAKVNIVKQDAADKTALEGAVFKVYGSADTTCDKSDVVKNNEITVKDKSEWITDREGTVAIDGLHVNDWADNKTATAPQYQAYCLVETKSPAGYELLSKPIQLVLSKKTPETDFKGSSDDGAVVISDIKPATYELTATVKNIKDTTPNLPMTGGMGIGVLAAIGAALVGAGAWFARRNSKKS